MQEARVKFSNAKIAEFRTILGRLLLSMPRNEFYIEISNKCMTMFVYDPELHQIRLCTTLDASFFQEINCSGLMVFSVPNLRDFFNNFSLSPIQVKKFNKKPHTVTFLFEKGEDSKLDEVARLVVFSYFDCFNAEERYASLKSFELRIAESPTNLSRQFKLITEDKVLILRGRTNVLDVLEQIRKNQVFFYATKDQIVVKNSLQV